MNKIPVEVDFPESLAKIAVMVGLQSSQRQLGLID